MFLNKENEFFVLKFRGYHFHGESSLVAIRHIFICTHLFYFVENYIISANLFILFCEAICEAAKASWELV